MGVETQLKLKIDPGHLARLGELPIVREHVRTVVPPKKVTSRYFDTPGLDLWSRHTSLCVRKEGRRWLQDLKTQRKIHSGLHERVEVKIPRGNGRPEFGEIIEASDVRWLAKSRIPAHLHPVFEIEFRRRGWILEMAAGSTLELVVDEGAVIAGEQREAICEIELHLRSGTSAALYHAARMLSADVHVCLDNVSKVERGFRLVGAVRKRPSKKSDPVELAPDGSVDSAISGILQNCLDQALANIEPAVGGFPEGIHQLRVGLRRFRTCLGLFRRFLPKGIRREILVELSELWGLLGAVRDWDVFRFGLVVRMEAEFPGPGAYERFLQGVESIRQPHHERLRTYLREPACCARLIWLTDWSVRRGWHELMDADGTGPIEEPLAPAAAGVLQRNHRRIRKKGSNLATGSPADLHALRIQVKNQRYAVEFFSAMYVSRRARRYREALRNLQEHLGRFNDTVIMSSRILEELRESGLDPEALGWTGKKGIESNEPMDWHGVVLAGDQAGCGGSSNAGREEQLRRGHECDQDCKSADS